MEVKDIHIGGRETEVDWISKPKNLIDAFPKFDDLFDGIQDLRALHEEAQKVYNVRKSMGMTQGGSMMRVACIPKSLVAAIVQVWPDFLKNRKEFYAWLERHPEYRVSRSVKL